MSVTMYEVDMGVGYKHANGRTYEAMGEQSDGEWFCREADGTVYAEGYYERHEDDDSEVMLDEDGVELARIFDENEYEAFAIRMLTAGV